MVSSTRIERHTVASVARETEGTQLRFTSGLVVPIAAEEDEAALLLLASVSQQCQVPLGLCLRDGRILGIGSLLRSVPRAVWRDQQSGHWNVWFWVSPGTFQLRQDHGECAGFLGTLQDAQLTSRSVTAVVRGSCLLGVTDAGD